MGRNKIDLDTEAVLDLLQQGLSQVEAAGELGVSIPTLAKKIAEMQTKQGLILKYRAIQSLQLTELQCRCLDAITPEKIAVADLKDLVGAYKILKDKELVVEGQPTEIRGLVAYLVELEKRNLALSEPIDVSEFEEFQEGKTLQ
ncbi:MAG: hypothetical protein EHM49_05035 [Deltaproteobacteria bacterium]|nr:MAG: hypothetical protein EHM49_05035 [Deltaproteobacteria bacterium]